MENKRTYILADIVAVAVLGVRYWSGISGRSDVPDNRVGADAVRTEQSRTIAAADSQAENQPLQDSAGSNTEILAGIRARDPSGPSRLRQVCGSLLLYARQLLADGLKTRIIMNWHKK